ncbi:rhodanese-like domain-containing protein [Rhodobacteraceae bacterium M382]|nr:rhodanese-like domain-containing protein [Rhodobacteraceae bacterium M382]
MKNLALAVVMAGLAGPIWADPVQITREMPAAEVPLPEGGTATISRIQDNDNVVSGDWAKTSRACPPFCVQPMSPAEGVTTIGELELIAMLQDPKAIVVDSRIPDHYKTGTIAGSINIPYTEAADRLDALGCEIDFDGFDCEGAKPVALFCNGPWCGQSPNAARNMIKAGYPADLIHYYRGGMQVWRMLGLSVEN